METAGSPAPDEVSVPVVRAPGISRRPRPVARLCGGTALDAVADVGDLDAWVNPPRPALSPVRGRRADRGTRPRMPHVLDLVEQFCQYQRKQRGKTAGEVATYRWNLEQFLRFVQAHTGRPARLADFSSPVIQAWMDTMAAADLALNTLRCRQATLSSFCTWLVKRGHLLANPILQLDRPPQQRVPPTVPTPRLMDALVQAAQARGRPRDVALFLVLRYTGMRRASVAALRVRHLEGSWGFRGVPVKGGTVRDIPVPGPVMRVLHAYVAHVLRDELGAVTPDTPLFWSTWGRRAGGKHQRPMTGKNIWRLCKVYGRRIGAPTLKPHDLRHGVAIEVLEQRHDLEEVRGLLGHARLDTTQIYTTIRPRALKRAVAFYDAAAQRLVGRDHPQPGRT